MYHHIKFKEKYTVQIHILVKDMATYALIKIIEAAANRGQM